MANFVDRNNLWRNTYKFKVSFVPFCTVVPFFRMGGGVVYHIYGASITLAWPLSSPPKDNPSFLAVGEIRKCMVTGAECIQVVIYNNQELYPSSFNTQWHTDRQLMGHQLKIYSNWTKLIGMV